MGDRGTIKGIAAAWLVAGLLVAVVVSAQETEPPPDAPPPGTPTANVPLTGTPAPAEEVEAQPDPDALLAECRSQEDPCLALELCRQARKAMGSRVDQELEQEIKGLDLTCREREAARATERLRERIPEPHVRIDPGRFRMGALPGEAGRERTESPHNVRLTRPFLAQTTEVTQAQWEALTGENPSYFKACGPECPVESVTWYEAVAFANIMSVDEGLEPCYMDPEAGRPYTMESARAGHEPTWPRAHGCQGWRLPTEAEWEYLARAGSQKATPLADMTLEIDGANQAQLLDVMARYGGNSGVKYSSGVECDLIPLRQYPGEDCGPFLVGLKRPNSWGLYDVLGNVWEWAWDDFALYDLEDMDDPIGSAVRIPRVDELPLPGVGRGDQDKPAESDQPPTTPETPEGAPPAEEAPETEAPPGAAPGAEPGPAPPAAPEPDDGDRGSDEVDEEPAEEAEAPRSAVPGVLTPRTLARKTEQRVRDARVTRGCSWISNARHCRVAFRGQADPGLRSFNQGLRLVRTIQ